MRLELRGRQRCAARQRTSLSAGEDIGSRSLSGVLAAVWRLGVGGCRSLTRHEGPLSSGNGSPSVHSPASATAPRSLTTNTTAAVKATAAANSAATSRGGNHNRRRARRSPARNATETRSGTLLDLLAERPRLVVIDEAQWLNRDCIEYLRRTTTSPRSSRCCWLAATAACSRASRCCARGVSPRPVRAADTGGGPRLFSNQYERQSFTGRSVARQDRDCGVVRFADSQRGRSLMIPMHGDTHD